MGKLMIQLFFARFHYLIQTANIAQNFFNIAIWKKIKAISHKILEQGFGLKFCRNFPKIEM
jgi:hypothetical protein